MTLVELKAVLQQKAVRKASLAVPKDPDQGKFCEQHTKKRLNSLNAQRTRSTKKLISTLKARKTTSARHPAAPTHNFFTLMRAVEVNTMTGNRAGANLPTQQQQAAPLGTGRQAVRLPLLTLITSVNLLNFQGDLKAIAKDSFKFRTSQNGIRMVTKEREDYLATLCHHDATKLHPYNFHYKSEKHIKAATHHLPDNMLADDIPNELVALGFSVIIVHQMMVNQPLPHRGSQKHQFPSISGDTSPEAKNP
jgi:hypothetical protein